MARERELLTIQQAADALALKPITIRLWASARKIASVKIGQRAVRIPRTELDRLIQSGLRPALPERDRR